jgi:ATP phosphoribosyltransferase
MTTNLSTPVRISLPSKGRLTEDSLALLEACGLPVYRPNPRQYEALIPALPGLTVLFQRPADIVVSVRDGSVDFGITGMDVIAERRGPNGDVLVLHDALGFGACTLMLAVPEDWQDVHVTAELIQKAGGFGRPLRVVTRYAWLTGSFLEQRGIPHVLISAEGTLETAPAIGYADLICDIVSSGQTLRDNRLRPLEDGLVISSQASLIANRKALKTHSGALEMARILLEYFEAHLRASGDLAIFANMRGESPDMVAAQIFKYCHIHGLQGPTVSRVIVREDQGGWYAANLIVPRSQLFETIQDLRRAGGSGVVVLPVSYIFDEEPPRYKAMLEALTQ